MAEVAVIVPVLNRPQNAAPFMESLRASGAWAEVMAICERGTEDNIAWNAAGAGYFSAPAVHTFAEKVNLAVFHTKAPWLFLTGDDVRFHPGWLDAALAKADETGAKVIGTGGSMGISDEFSPHLLIERRYVEEQGASWDGPGIVCHEGYRHNYVDLEIIAVARSRGVWAMAWDSIVEHMHPFFGKGEDDSTYRLGQASVDQDAALWTERRNKYAVPA